jgi:hypothetical protein
MARFRVGVISAAAGAIAISIHKTERRTLRLTGDTDFSSLCDLFKRSRCSDPKKSKEKYQ